MAKIISIHSFRGGTGKSNTSANVAALLATEGRRVGVVDTDIAVAKRTAAVFPGRLYFWGRGRNKMLQPV